MVWKLTSEEQLADVLADKINPFWHQHVHLGEMQGKDNIRLAWAWCCPTNCTHTIVISSGRIESLLKYKEVIYDFYQNGFAVFIFDHRGQGLSDRLSENPHHGYVKTFDDYVDDVQAFLANVVDVYAPPGPRHLLCHSMGSAIGALTLLRQPDYFRNVVFCSPMFGIRPALPDWLATLLISRGLRKNKKKHADAGYFIGQKDYHPLPFSKNRLTQSEVRYRLFRELYDSSPSIQLGGVTTEWLAAARSAMNQIAVEATNISIPVLILSAGRDAVVDNRQQRKIAQLLPNGVIRVIEGAHHELLIEKDSYRQAALTATLDFFGHA